MRRGALSKKAGVLAAALVLGFTPIPPQESHAGPAADSIQREIARLFELHRHAVVRVRASDQLGVRLGSGFFIDPSGTVYTHSGVVLQASDVTVNFQGRNIPAKIIASDPRTGIALLKTDTISPFIPVGSSEEIPASTPVVAIGFPGEYESCPTIGLLVGREFHRDGKQFATSHLRANMAVEAGYGGAPVVDFSGNVIGIVAASIGQGASCYILPIGAAEKVRSDIARFGELRPGWIGIEVEDAPSPVAGSRARIIAMPEGSPAAKFGLCRGDILLGIDGRKVCSIQDLVDAAYHLTAGEEAHIHVSRDNKTIDLPVTPVLHPTAAAVQDRADSGMPVPN